LINLNDLKSLEEEGLCKLCIHNAKALLNFLQRLSDPLENQNLSIRHVSEKFTNQTEKHKRKWRELPVVTQKRSRSEQ